MQPLHDRPSHPCPLCEGDAIPERCPAFRFNWETDDDSYDCGAETTPSPTCLIKKNFLKDEVMI